MALAQRVAAAAGAAVSVRAAMRLLLAVRIAAALWAPLGDCDEVFNYWEPAHALAHGVGMQTWEYAPAFALRSYAYLWPHVAIARAVAALGGDKVRARLSDVAHRRRRLCGCSRRCCGCANVSRLLGGIELSRVDCGWR